MLSTKFTLKVINAIEAPVFVTLSSDSEEASDEDAIVALAEQCYVNRDNAAVRKSCQARRSPLLDPKCVLWMCEGFFPPSFLALASSPATVRFA